MKWDPALAGFDGSRLRRQCEVHGDHHENVDRCAIEERRLVLPLFNRVDRRGIEQRNRSEDAGVRDRPLTIDPDFENNHALDAGRERHRGINGRDFGHQRWRIDVSADAHRRVGSSRRRRGWRWRRWRGLRNLSWNGTAGHRSDDALTFRSGVYCSQHLLELGLRLWRRWWWSWRRWPKAQGHGHQNFLRHTVEECRSEGPLSDRVDRRAHEFINQLPGSRFGYRQGLKIALNPRIDGDDRSVRANPNLENHG
jgi:hypothetical protein